MKYVYHFDVKNNQGIPTRFVGTAAELDDKFKQYFDSDSLGKIIGMTKTPLVNRDMKGIITDVYNPRYGLPIDDSGLTKENTHKRYHKYL